MATSPTHRKLTQRDREILKDVIGTYIFTGEPVSSRSVAKLERHGLSAATIRNVMADLEEMGYLSHPHTSAGRVPTGEGYHFYIESLMPNRPVPVRERRYIEAGLKATDSEELMASAGQLLSDLTHQIGIVITPAIGETVVKAVNFLQLTGRKVLCVVVSTSGFIDNKVIETEEPLSREHLTRISNYLTDNFGGQTVGEIRQRLLALMAEDRAKVDQLLGNAIALAQQALRAGEAPEVVVKGTSAVLNRPELADIDRVRRLLETFSNKVSLLRILGQLIEGEGVRVVIGEDSDLTSDLDFSLVATTYGIGDTPLGTVGIFGPSRMEYQKMIPLVDLFGEKLSRALEVASFERT